MTPASGPVLSESEVRDQLTTYLNEYFNNDSSKVNEALALYDSEEVKAKISDPQIRAAFAGMKGTLLEPTIDYFMNGGSFTSMRYGGVREGAIASSNGTTVVVNRVYQSEDFRYLIGIHGHEILHHDFSTPSSEEAILNSLSSMTYMQVLLKNPELAYTGTELSRQMNDAAMLFMNSRENDSPDSEIFAPSGVGVAPGSPRNAPDIWTFLEGNGSSSASDVLGQIMSNLGLPAASEFSQATAESFENLNDNWMSDKNRVQISVLLQLVTPAEIAETTGLSEQEVIDRLELQPYLDAIR